MSRKSHETSVISDLSYTDWKCAHAVGYWIKISWNISCYAYGKYYRALSKDTGDLIIRKLMLSSYFFFLSLVIARNVHFFQSQSHYYELFYHVKFYFRYGAEVDRDI